MSHPKVNYDGLAYFFRHSELDRMCDFQEQMQAIKHEHPEVYAAYENMKIARKTFNVLFDNMLDSAPDERDKES